MAVTHYLYEAIRRQADAPAPAFNTESVKMPIPLSVYQDHAGENPNLMFQDYLNNPNREVVDYLYRSGDFITASTYAAAMAHRRQIESISTTTLSAMRGAVNQLPRSVERVVPAPDLIRCGYCGGHVAAVSHCPNCGGDPR